MKFKTKDAEYLIDAFDVIHQLNPEPFAYDKKYISTYSTPKYTSKAKLLQNRRFSFAVGIHGRPINSLIDVGFGDGAFMKLAKEQIKIVGGIDITSLAVPSGCYYTNRFEQVDVVTFHDSLEHIPDLMFMREIPAETIIISLPYCHFKTRGIEWFCNEYYHRKKNEHLHHFDQFSLGKFMDNMGWYCVSISNHEDGIRKRDPEWNILTMGFKRKQEIWKPIKKWEDKYEVSSFGRVKSLSRIIGSGDGYLSKERILKQMQDPDGYMQISFPIENRKNTTAKVHKLVGNAFISNIDDKPCMNHKNGIRWHNYATNLEWVTIQENVQHGFDYNGRIIDQSAMKKPIRQINLAGETIKTWESGLQLEKEGGFNRSAIKKAIDKRKPYYGYYWDYSLNGYE